MYKVLLQSQPEKYYRKANPKIAQKLAVCFENLENDPFGINTKALSGIHKGRRRCRIGSLRVVYEVDQDSQIVHVIAILPRGDVYKKGFVF